MSQHDFDIANQTAANARADINNALKALASLSSGESPPNTTYANMLWLDTDTIAGSDVYALKVRSSADDAWITLLYVDNNTNDLSYVANRDVIGTSGGVQGYLGNQNTSSWTTGTGTTESLVSPAKIKSAIESLALTVGVGQTWQDVSGSRSANVSYQNTTGKPIQWAVHGSSGQEAQVSSNGTTWIKVATLGAPGSFETAATPVIPNNHYYRTTGGFNTWAELR